MPKFQITVECDGTGEKVYELLSYCLRAELIYYKSRKQTDNKETREHSTRMEEICTDILNSLEVRQV